MSHKFYQKHTERADEGDDERNGEGDATYIEASWIPELRRFCRGITVDAQFVEARNFLESSLPRLTTSLELWTAAYRDRVSAEPRTVARDFGRLEQRMLRAPLNVCDGASFAITRSPWYLLDSAQPADTL